jgi:hemerythrin
MCCGCPADTVKHLKKAGIIQRSEKNGFVCETGPNAILLSDAMIQNGQLSNLTEFPVLQMLYLQGMNIPGHPNYGKSKPILVGLRDHIESQIRYIYRGNYGLTSLEEILSCGVEETLADKIYDIKMQFAYGRISPPEELFDKRIVGNQPVQLINGVSIERTAYNVYSISYHNERVEVDLNLGPEDRYEAPFDLPYKPASTAYFSVVHSGEGNGWDVGRPCMASVVVFRGKNYIIDAGPNILSNLKHLGISISEIEGIFQSHVHDDHFAGLTELIKADRKFKYYTTALVRKTAEKKLAALMNFPEKSFHLIFDCIDLSMNAWNDLGGLQVKPVYSPHPVETNVFYFSATGKGGKKTYAHLADTVAFEVFEDMVAKSGQDRLTAEDFSGLHRDYLQKVDLKKVDVGGGLIHGSFMDYREDTSRKIVFAHTDEFNEEVEKVDRFGTAEVLIHDTSFEFEKERALDFLGFYFGSGRDQISRALWNADVHYFNPRDTIVESGPAAEERVFLILSGVVSACEQERAEEVPAGTFVGYSNRYFDHSHILKYVAESHVCALKMDISAINMYLKKHAGDFLVSRHLSWLGFLERNPLFSGAVSRAVLNRLCMRTEAILIEQSTDFHGDDMADLYVIHKGKALIHRDGKELLRLDAGDFYGGLNILDRVPDMYQVHVQKRSTVLRINADHIRKIPSVLWKILEVNEKRNYFCTLSSEN